MLSDSPGVPVICILFLDLALTDVYFEFCIVSTVMNVFLFAPFSPEAVSESIVVLADEWLLQLPLEALKTFAVPQLTSISRDFSLQFHYHRVHPAERSGKERKRWKTIAVM